MIGLLKSKLRLEAAGFARTAAGAGVRPIEWPVGMVLAHPAAVFAQETLYQANSLAPSSVNFR
jgi:hypothetical protein